MEIMFRKTKAGREEEVVKLRFWIRRQKPNTRINQQQHINHRSSIFDDCPCFIRSLLTFDFLWYSNFIKIWFRMNQVLFYLIGVRVRTEGNKKWFDWLFFSFRVVWGRPSSQILIEMSQFSTKSCDQIFLDFKKIDYGAEVPLFYDVYKFCSSLCCYIKWYTLQVL